MNILWQNKKYFFILLLIGAFAYFPIFFNGFVWDDKPFIIDNPEVHQMELLSLLSHNSFNSGPFYRPLPAIYFAIIYALFGENAFYYHIIQLFLHLVATYLLFIFFCRFFKPGIAFFLALIFFIHPIQVESVAYIGATQSELYFIPGIVALILSQKQFLSRSRFLLIISLLAMSTFTKETGALFFVVVIAYRYLFKLGKIRDFFVAGTLLAVLYLCVRVFIGDVTYNMSTAISIASLSFSERLLNMPSVFAYYLKTFVFPASLIIWQAWTIKTVTVQNFLIPAFASGIFLILLLWVALVLHKKAVHQAAIPIEHLQGKKDRKYHLVKIDYAWANARSFIFFLFYFVIGMVLLLHIVPLDMTVADRWFYFPIVGLLGLMGIGLQLLPSSNKMNMKWFVIAALIIVSLLSFRTFNRTFNYKDNLTLYSHDLKEEQGNGSYYLINGYVSELANTGSIDEALHYAKKAVEEYPSVTSLNSLGTVYQKSGHLNEALLAYNRSIDAYYAQSKKSDNTVPAYINKVKVLFMLHRDKEALDFLNNEALKIFPKEPSLYIGLALVELHLGNRQEAVKAAKLAHAIRPNHPEIVPLYSLLKITD